MDMTVLEKELALHQVVLEKTIKESGEIIQAIIDAMVHCFKQGNKILLCGNGGSAADAQHVAGEFVNRFGFDRPALPAIALTTDTSVLTCIANDSSFENVFSRQVEALGRPGDILVGISTSGGSINVLRALETARTRKLLTIGFTGENGRQKLTHNCDLLVVVLSDDTPRIQECHLFVWHYICGLVEQRISIPG